jgi:hypothetical protein
MKDHELKRFLRFLQEKYPQEIINNITPDRAVNEYVEYLETQIFEFGQNTTAWPTYPKAPDLPGSQNELHSLEEKAIINNFTTALPGES